jgi:hypothetical protein
VRGRNAAQASRIEALFGNSLAGRPGDFEIAATVTTIMTDDVRDALPPAKIPLAFYIGGMGAKERNFHLDMIGRLGYAEQAACELSWSRGPPGPGLQPADPSAVGSELEAALMAHCRDHLALYKTPRSLEFVTELPRTPTGKLLRRVLVAAAEERRT